MTIHRFDPATGNHCKCCGALKGSHAEECLAPENLISLQPYLAKRAWEKGKIIGANSLAPLMPEPSVQLILGTDPHKEPA